VHRQLRNAAAGCPEKVARRSGTLLYICEAARLASDAAEPRLEVYLEEGLTDSDFLLFEYMYFREICFTTTNDYLPRNTCYSLLAGPQWRFVSNTMNLDRQIFRTSSSFPYVRSHGQFQE
jgi:hypothetical protein